MRPAVSPTIATLSCNPTMPVSIRSCRRCGTAHTTHVWTRRLILKDRPRPLLGKRPCFASVGQGRQRTDRQCRTAASQIKQCQWADRRNDGHPVAWADCCDTRFTEHLASRRRQVLTDVENPSARLVDLRQYRLLVMIKAIQRPVAAECNPVWRVGALVVHPTPAPTRRVGPRCPGPARAGLRQWPLRRVELPYHPAAVSPLASAITDALSCRASSSRGVRPSNSGC